MTFRWRARELIRFGMQEHFGASINFYAAFDLTQCSPTRSNP
jgi:hypothetical protein